MRWIDTTDLKNWAPRRDCQEHLPLVIRRLIRSTVKDIASINFPAGDSVIYPGWDGKLESKERTEYIPEGLSIWEIGTSQDIQGKAEEDYQKRKKDPLGLDPSEATFIFVTSRVWIAKQGWCNGKKKEGFWKDVRVYDAEILEEWLEQASAVGAWLAKHIGKYPKGAISLEDWWNEWSLVTTPSIALELVIAGRINQVELIRKWLNTSPSVKAVQAATSDEAIAFIAAVINTLPENEKEFYLSKSIIVSDPESFRYVTATCKNGLLIITQFEQVEIVAIASQRGHHIYVPIGPDNTVTTEKIELPRLGREEFVAALMKMGISEEEAEKYSRDTARSLTVLRRQLSPIAKQPEWAKQDSAREILPALLAEKWNENKKGDREILSEIAGTSYDEFEGSLAKWLYKPDQPILKIGEVWRLVSPLDAFFALSPFLTRNDLDKFKQIALKVLSAVNPAFELEPEKRWMASVYGKESLYSGTSIEGIAQTLVLIGVFGDNARIDIPYSAQSWVDSLVQDLLHEADWKLWHSLSDILPLIAEASPSSFLDAVETSLSQDPSPIMGMFSETEDTLTSSSAHPSLLWALEGLAWNPKLLGRVTLILGKLARLDPGGKLANRPANSLRTIFLLWLPHTYATLEQRLEALDTLLEREPEVGWNLLTKLMPRSHDHCTATYKTRWRHFLEQRDNKVTIVEHLKSITVLMDRILANIANDGKRWVELMENFSVLPAGETAKVTEKLRQCVDVIKDNRFELWNKLRSILSSHRSFPDAIWALPESELKEIEKIYSQLEPQDKIKRNRWLFDEHWPGLPEVKERGDYKKMEGLIAKHRVTAIEVIKNEAGLDGLIKLSCQTENPWLVGIATAECGLVDKEEQNLFSLLNNENEKKVRLAQAYISQKAFKNGKTWIERLINVALSQQWPSDKVVTLFLALPQNRTVWSLLSKFNDQIRNEYWKKLSVRLFDLSTEDKTFALNQLANVRRHFTALDTAALFAKELSPKLIAELMKKAALEESIDDFRVVAHWDIEELFKILDESSEIQKEEIAKLEWLYLPILASVGSGRPPKVLHKELSNSPKFFSEVIRDVDRPKNEDWEEKEEDLPPELKEQRAHLAWKLLHTWKTVPGGDSSGKINYGKLKSWVDKAREFCKNLDRIEICDDHIGQVLAHAAPDEEGNWPAKGICRIIDEVGSNELDNGFSVGIYNKRGMVTKSPFEGGKQERELAEQFRKYADKWVVRFPRTAAILRKVVERYENEARREDKEAERRDLEW